jgi:subtilisin family serine protease
MKRRHFRIGYLALFLIQALTGTSYSQQERKWQRVLIESRKPYDGLIRAIEAKGGHVTQTFTYVDGVAADVPEDAVPGIRSFPGVQAVSKDIEVERPTSVNPIRSRTASQLQRNSLATDSSNPLTRIPANDLKSLASSNPETYSINNAGTRIGRLHANGFTGEGIVVAVIDSGVRNGFKLVQDSIVGGIDFVDDGAPGPAGDSQSDWKKESNDGHGTFAAGLIAGNASFVVKGVMKDALELYAPGTLVDGKLHLIGTAPNAHIYVVRVFGDDSSTGASTSIIIAALEHVIDQRLLYEDTRGKKGVKVEVANLSFGISTLAAGLSLLDKTVDAMLKAGIVPVVSAGNTGPSALTFSSPGSSRSALKVGASSRAVNERILNEVIYSTQFPDEYYPGIGGDIRPFGGTQTAWFSSRGPTADGRQIPEVVASGVGNIGQGYCPDQILDACFKRLSLASGTSFSAPIVSGIAAALIDAFPRATATQIRNAIILSGRTGQIAPYFDEIDRGRGLPDAYRAYQLLDSGFVPDVLPPVTAPFDLVEDNIEFNTDLNVVAGSVSETLTDLKPGERGEILYNVPPNTGRVVVRIRNIQMTGPQNPFFGGDGLFFYVHSAKTSAIRGIGDYLVNGVLFLGGEDEQFSLENPDTGIMRITLNPDTLNAGMVTADVLVHSIPESFTPTTTFSGIIDNGETEKFTLPVEAGTTRLDIVLSWVHDWSRYPTSDVDLIVCSPSIAPTILDCKALGIKTGATLNGPERVSIPSPAAGNWTLLVVGFNVPTVSESDNFDLRIRATH